MNIEKSNAMKEFKQNQESSDIKQSETWSEFEPEIQINGIEGLLRNWNAEVDDEGNIIRTVRERKKVVMPHIEKRATIILRGGLYNYGSRVGAGEEYIKKIPDEKNTDNFSKTYFALQKLVDEGILTSPITGNDGPTLNDFFWETTKQMSVSELISLIQEKTELVVEKSK